MGSASRTKLRQLLKCAAAYFANLPAKRNVKTAQPLAKFQVFMSKADYVEFLTIPNR